MALSPSVSIGSESQSKKGRMNQECSINSLPGIRGYTTKSRPPNSIIGYENLGHSIWRMANLVREVDEMVWRSCSNIHPNCDLTLATDADIKLFYEELSDVLNEYWCVLAERTYDYVKAPAALKPWLQYYQGLEEYHMMLRGFLMQLAYRKANQKCFPLPHDATNEILSSARAEMDLRRVVAERILRLERNEDAYQSTQVRPAETLLAISEKHHWLLDAKSCPPLEWRYFVITVGSLTVDQYWYERDVEAGIRQEFQHIPVEKPTIETFTTSCTAEEINAAEEECGICLSKFNTKDGAVRTRCWHVVGSCCLQDWANEHNTCPFCRTALMGAVDRLPKSCRPHFSWAMAILETEKTFDKEIDAFLLAGVQETNSLEFVELLFKLSRLDHAMQEAKAGVIVAFEELRPCKKYGTFGVVGLFLSALQRANRRIGAL
jgi:hypothetical protein